MVVSPTLDQCERPAQMTEEKPSIISASTNSSQIHGASQLSHPWQCGQFWKRLNCAVYINTVQSLDSLILSLSKMNRSHWREIDWLSAALLQISSGIWIRVTVQTRVVATHVQLRWTISSLTFPETDISEDCSLSRYLAETALFHNIPGRLNSHWSSVNSRWMTSSTICNLICQILRSVPNVTSASVLFWILWTICWHFTHDNSTLVQCGNRADYSTCLSFDSLVRVSCVEICIIQNNLQNWNCG